MTREYDICIKCKNLVAYTNGTVTTDKGKSLISQCYYGGKNAGNRKTCKKFEEAPKEIIEARYKCLKGSK